MEEGETLLHDSVLTVAVAINGTQKSKYVVQWALNNFSSENNIMIKLLHVQQEIKMVPTAMGNYLPVHLVRDDVVDAYKKEQKWKTEEKLCPYQKMCAEKQIEAKVEVLEADDVAEAIGGYVAKNAISRIVIGASSWNPLIRKFKRGNLSSRIAECTPNFCTVYVILKGKLSSVRQSDGGEMQTSSVIDYGVRVKDDSSLVSFSSSSSSSSKSDAEANNSPRTSMPKHLENLGFNNKDREISSSVDTFLTRDKNLFEDLRFSSSSISVDTQCSSSIASVSCQTEMSWNFDTSSSSFSSRERSPTQNVELVGSPSVLSLAQGLESLHKEIDHFIGIFEIQNASSSNRQKLEDTDVRRKEEMFKQEDMLPRLERARKMAQQEKERGSAEEEETEHVAECTERGVSQRDLERHAPSEVIENQSLENSLKCASEPYLMYTWEEIVAATFSFSDALKIGVGANGTVYRGKFHHTLAAVKVLHSKEGYNMRQFNQELEVLSRVHHPHLLLLLGACPEKACLVYEYMENGSLEDRLQCKNNTPPLPWFCRFRIAWEVASALIFLHSSKPEPVVHRDLKPANILLDSNFVSKIGDAGLCTLLSTPSMPFSTIYKDTAPVGTFFYMDPEYQRTGLLSPKSDAYAFGMVILQLLTAKSPMSLPPIVESALEKDCLMEVLDSKAGLWPESEAKELAILGLSCLELRGKDRPDLKDKVFPVLERLKDVAEQVHDSILPPAAPKHFICPLLKIVMDDPCIASDGHTYNRNAIEAWLSRNDKSPVTNLPMANDELIPNNSLLFAIKNWKTSKQWNRRNFRVKML